MLSFKTGQQKHCSLYYTNTSGVGLLSTLTTNPEDSHSCGSPVHQQCYCDTHTGLHYHQHGMGKHSWHWLCTKASVFVKLPSPALAPSSTFITLFSFRGCGIACDTWGGQSDHLCGFWTSLCVSQHFYGVLHLVCWRSYFFHEQCIGGVRRVVKRQVCGWCIYILWISSSPVAQSPVLPFSHFFVALGHCLWLGLSGT